MQVLALPRAIRPRQRSRAIKPAGFGADRHPPEAEAVQLQAGAQGAARAMAAARKSFRGGRPVTPKPCPRCGAACASAVQAAAHCVGPAVRERQEAARVTAARRRRSPEDLKREYPKWKYHRSEPAAIVEDTEAEDDLGEGWADRTGAFKV